MYNVSALKENITFDLWNCLMGDNSVDLKFCALNNGEFNILRQKMI